MLKIIVIVALLIVGGTFSLYSAWIALHPKDSDVTKVYVSHVITPDKYIKKMRTLCRYKGKIAVALFPSCSGDLKKETMVSDQP